MNAGANVINVTSTHGASTLRVHINVSVEKGIMGMDLNVKEKVFVSRRSLTYLFACTLIMLGEPENAVRK